MKVVKRHKAAACVLAVVFFRFFTPDVVLAQAVSAMETKHQGSNLTGPPTLRTIKMGSKENTDILTIKQPHHTDAESHQSSCEIGFQGLSTVLAARNLFLHAC